VARRRIVVPPRDRPVTPAFDLDALVTAARAAQACAYAPYSRLRIGAALLGADGRVFAGCNVENAAYPAGLCAERAALGVAIAAGCRTFHALVVVTDQPAPAPPCGICRQALVEFAPALAITSVGAAGAPARWTLDALLPAPFTPAALPTP
jgi:cytidine deaminase